MSKNIVTIFGIVLSVGAMMIGLEFIVQLAV